MHEAPGARHAASPGASFRWRDFDLIGSTPPRAWPGRLPFPFPHGSGSGALEFVRATITTSDPVIVSSVSNFRRAASRDRRLDRPTLKVIPFLRAGGQHAIVVRERQERTFTEADGLSGTRFPPNYITPYASIASATFTKPPMFAPRT